MTQESPRLNDDALWALSYRSRTARFPGRAELDALAAEAQARNRECGLTGMLLYEHGRFFQWLEGPKAALETVWRSIQRDPRHLEIVCMSLKPATFRLYSGWDMQLFSKAADFEDEGGPPRNVRSQTEFARRTADLALESDASSIGELFASERNVRSAFRYPAELVESAARLVGDDWLTDDCSSVDLTLAMACLQRVMRKVDLRSGRRSSRDASRKSILVATVPRETHLIGAILVADKFRDADWDVEIAFPKTDQELVEIVTSDFYSAATLSLSDVFARKDRLAALAQTIAAMRAASLNPSLVVCVGGRAFAETPDTGADQVGADTGFLSADEAVENTRLALLKATDEASTSEDGGENDPLRNMKLPPGWYRAS